MKALLIALVACIGCSSATPSGPCKPRSGSYLVRYTYRSGTCPKTIGETVVNASSSSSGTSSCRDQSTESADHCAVTLDTSCPSNGFDVENRGKITWSVDGATAGGTVAITLRQGNAIECTGTYDITYTRQ